MQFLLLLLSIFTQASAPTMWAVKTSGLDTNLRGVSAVSGVDSDGNRIRAIWACGSKGVILKSVNDGADWTILHVKGGETLDFRGIQAFGALTAYVISIGDGENSRIYKTTDGGANWSLQFTDNRKEFFLDDIVCISEQRCFVAGDPIDGKLFLASTEDGEHWKELSRDSMPAALKGEGAFAASSTTLAIANKKDIYIGTGGPAARVFHSPDLGKSWTVVNTPILAGEASQGIFSVFPVENPVVIVGGDYKDLKRNEKAAAYSSDGGATWKLSDQLPGGFRSGLAYVGGTTFIAVGPSGEDITSDSGAHWRASGTLNLNAVTSLGPEVWAVGEKGTVAVMHYRTK